MDVYIFMVTIHFYGISYILFGNFTFLLSLVSLRFPILSMVKPNYRGTMNIKQVHDHINRMTRHDGDVCFTWDAPNERFFLISKEYITKNLKLCSL